MSNLTNEGQKYTAEVAFRGAARAARLYVGLTNATLSKTSVLSDAVAGEPLGTFAAPGALTCALAAAGAGLLSNGVYSYKAVFRTANGQTEAGTVSSNVTVVDNATNGKVNLTAIPLGPTGTTARDLYRTDAGGATWKFLATLADNTTTTYLDNIADASLGALAPTANSTGQKAPPGAVTIALAAAGAGNLSAGDYSYRITFVTPAGETEGGAESNAITVTDPGTNGRMALSAIPLGPFGVTARKLYRTEANTPDYWGQVGTINDNTTTTYTDNLADVDLGVAIPEDNWTAPNGYTRYEIGQESVNWPTSALDAGDWQLTSLVYSWLAAGGTIGPVVRVFMCDLSSGVSGGRLLMWWDLSVSRTLLDTESLGWYGKFKQK